MSIDQENSRPPLQMTFVLDPPIDFDVRLINMLILQAANGKEYKADILRACKFVVQKLEEEEKK